MESKYSGRGNRLDVGDDSYDNYAAAKSSSKSVLHDLESQRKPIHSSVVADSKTASNHGGASSKALGAKSVALDTGFKDEKSILDEIQQDIEADEEFERLKNKLVVPVPEVGRSALARNFVRGFRIMSMNMRDATTGRLMWRSAEWDVAEMFSREISEEIPRDILQCRAVSREIVFSSVVSMNNFRLEQRVYFQGVCIEEWRFTFGYVMAGSRNSWQQTIDAAPPADMLPAAVLSGNIVFETSFYDDKEFLCKNSIRIFYV